MSFSFDHSQEPTIRHDPLSDRRIYLAPRRDARPNDLINCRKAECPFCIKNSSLTPDPVQQWPSLEALHWKSRIIPNRYPIVEIGRPATQTGGNAKSVMTTQNSVHAHGVHDVVIESPHHIESVLQIPFDDWVGVWTICQQRMKQLSTDSGFTWATIFKNGGVQAGASLAHVHSQLIAIDCIPPTISTKCDRVIHQPRLFRNILSDANDEGRVIHSYKNFVAIVPPAPRQPFEAWLISKNPSCFFHTENQSCVEDIARFTQHFPAALEHLLPGASYNWWLHQFPFISSSTLHKAAEHWHWHLEALPRITPLAGFELGTGYHVSTVPPKTAARLLRDTGCWK